MVKISKKFLVLASIFVVIISFSGCIIPKEENTSTGTISPTPTEDLKDWFERVSHETPIAPRESSTQPKTTIKQTKIDKPVNIAKLELEKYNGQFFSMEKPVGWDVYTVGYCSNLGILVTDRNAPQNQIFLFSTVGPMFLTERAKSETTRYMQNGGYYINYWEMPIVNPFTPENFLSNFYAMANTQDAKKNFPILPQLQIIKIISSENTGTPIEGSAKIMRALFKQNNKVSEGLFHVIVPNPNYQYIIDPMQEIENVYMFAGISTDKDKFRYQENELVQSLKSLIVSDSYIQQCIRDTQATTVNLLKNAKTYSEISDIYSQAWEDRNKADDIMSEKTADSTMGRDSVYDVNTGNVYNVGLDWYSKYDREREKYNMNLQHIPDDNVDLWTSPRLDERNIN